MNPPGENPPSPPPSSGGPGAPAAPHPPENGGGSARRGRGFWWTRIAAGAGACALAVPVAVVRPLDRSPWEESAAAALAVPEAAAMHAEAAAARSAPLEAGWAAVPLDLLEGEPLAGYGARRGAPSQPGGEPLFARAVHLRSAGTELVLLTADVLLIPSLVADAVQERLSTEGLPPESIYFLVTHTHGGPGGWGPALLEQAVCGPFDPGAVERLADRLAAAALAARRRSASAEWAWLRAEVPAHVANRTDRGGVTDPWLDALAVRRIEDRLTGVMAFYGAHATCFGPDRMSWTADYPGVLVERLESSGFHFAAFGSAAVGSQSPRGEGGGAERARSVGEGLAEALLAELPQATWRSGMALGTSRRELPVPRFQIRLGETSWRTSDWIARRLRDPVAPFHVVRLDEVWLAGVPVEISAMLTAPLRERAREEGRWLCVTCFNGEYLGYALPPEWYDSGVYEAGMSFLGPGGGLYSAAVVRALCGLE